MAYSVFVSRYNNNSSIIKNSFSRGSSLGMSAYISDQFRLDMDTKTQYLPKKGRDESEVEFTALVLPSALPKKQLDQLMGDEDYLIKRVKDRFIDSSDVVGKENILIQDAEVISQFWSLNDKNIKDIQEGNPSLKKRKTDMRLYHLYLFTSPVAHKHFPKELGITFRDLRKIEEQAIHTVCEEMFLSKGLPLELGRHQNKENIIHYHIQTPARVLNYVYQNKGIEFNSSDFKAWLSKDIIYNKRKNMLTQKMKKDIWLNKTKADTSEYNKSRYVSWLNKYEKSKQELDDIVDIIAGIKVSGRTYFHYANKYKRNLALKLKKEIGSDSLFAKIKGTTELYLDTYAAVDNMKERYAEVLNELLIKAEIIKPGTQLYTYVKSTREFITIKEARNWNVSEERRIEVNKKLSKIWKIDVDFYNKPLKSKEKKKMKERQRLIIHGLKVVMKQSLARYKKEIATNTEKADSFISYWINRLELIKENYQEFITNLIDRSVFNFSWKKIVTSEVVFDEKNKEDTPKQFDDFEVIEVELKDKSIYDSPKEMNEETVDEMNDFIRSIMDKRYLDLEFTHKKALQKLNYKADLQNLEITIDIEGEEKTMCHNAFKDIMQSIASQREESFKEWIDSYYSLMVRKHPTGYPLVVPEDLIPEESKKINNHLEVLSEKKISLELKVNSRKKKKAEAILANQEKEETLRVEMELKAKEFVKQQQLAKYLQQEAEKQALYEALYSETEELDESMVDDSLEVEASNGLVDNQATKSAETKVVVQNDYELER